VANGHPGSRATLSWQRKFLGAEDLPDAKKVQRWYFVRSGCCDNADAFTMVVLGDRSRMARLDDGRQQSMADILAKRLQASAATQKIAW